MLNLLTIVAEVWAVIIIIIHLSVIDPRSGWCIMEKYHMWQVKHMPEFKPYTTSMNLAYSTCSRDRKLKICETISQPYQDP